MIDIIMTSGMTGFFNSDQAQETFLEFMVVFGPSCLPSKVWKSVRGELDAGTKSPLQVFAPGALSLTYFHLLNNINNLLAGKVSTAAYKGGKWSSPDEMEKKGRKKTGNVAYDQEGVDLYNLIRLFHMKLLKHEKFVEFNERAIELWGSHMSRQHEMRANKRRKTNKATQETAAPVFELLDGGVLGTVPVSVPV